MEGLLGFLDLDDPHKFPKMEGVQSVGFIDPQATLSSSSIAHRGISMWNVVESALASTLLKSWMIFGISQINGVKLNESNGFSPGWIWMIFFCLAIVVECWLQT